RD
ncbi:hypothetical protein BN1723_019346, partial [Verticillium longisporum]